MKSKILALLLIISLMPLSSACSQKEASEKIVLRVSNWEEYIDLGEWDEDEVIELESGSTILGENSMVDDFCEWYEDTYGIEVEVEYSTFGTNEDMYNRMLMGDTYDLVCPSEYMIMKMEREGLLAPFSEEFFDVSIEENYYIKGVSPYIKDVFDKLKMGDRPLTEIAAGYMWGTLGIVYNPEKVSAEDAKNWSLLTNKDYYRQVSIKDSIRDAYFAGASMYSFDRVMDKEFLESEDYHERLSEILNATDPETVKGIEKALTEAKKNVYSFETDSGKADMVTGKILANEQWSGDAVYTMDVAEEEGTLLSYSAPEEGTNLWFDGWVMLKAGVEGDKAKQHAAEAFVNFLSRPDNAIRNMYYIGYTSVIGGGESPDILDYINYRYYDDSDEAVEYPLGYFFSGDDTDTDYILSVSPEQTNRQLFAQYPPKSVVDRSVVMKCFTDEDNERINEMWINIRCW